MYADATDAMRGRLLSPKDILPAAEYLVAWRRSAWDAQGAPDGRACGCVGNRYMAAAATLLYSADFTLDNRK